MCFAHGCRRPLHGAHHSAGMHKGLMRNNPLNAKALHMRVLCVWMGGCLPVPNVQSCYCSVDVRPLVSPYMRQHADRALVCCHFGVTMVLQFSAQCSGFARQLQSHLCHCPCSYQAETFLHCSPLQLPSTSVGDPLCMQLSWQGLSLHTTLASRHTWVTFHLLPCLARVSCRGPRTSVHNGVFLLPLDRGVLGPSFRSFRVLLPAAVSQGI